MPEMRYVHIGYFITNSGTCIKVDSKKVRATVDMPAPMSDSGVKRILDVVQCITKFIPDSVWILNGKNRDQIWGGGKVGFKV